MLEYKNFENVILIKLISFKKHQKYKIGEMSSEFWSRSL